MQWKETVEQLSKNSGISQSLSKRIIILTELLEEIITEEHGEEIVAKLGELPLQSKKALDDGNQAYFDEIQNNIKNSSDEELREILRWYTTFFHLVNSLEQHEISRINRAREFEKTPDSPRKESIAEAVFRMKKADYSFEQALDVFQQMDIQPTITAHPTEARRRSILLKQQEITSMISNLDSDDITSGEKDVLKKEIKNQLKLLLLTDEIRSERMSVDDEVESGMFYFANSIWNSIPVLYNDILQAFDLYYGKEPEIPVVLKYRSWIGSDRDGNPNVTSSVTWNTVIQQRRLAFSLYVNELKSLRRYLSVSEKRSQISEELRQSLQKDEQDYSVSSRYKRRYRHEIYRQKITYMIHKIQHQMNVLEKEKAEILSEASRYTSNDFIKDLELIKSSIAEHGPIGLAKTGKLQDLIVRAKTFGFRMCALDIRQHSSLHEETVEELLAGAQVLDNYSRLSEDEKIRVLKNELVNPRPLSPAHTKRSEVADRVLSVLVEIRDMLQLDQEIFGSYIISMTHGISDMMEVMLLAKEVGLWNISDNKVESPLDIVPLFETIEDLEKSSELMDEMFKDELYAKHLEARSNFQEIMLGYSDSNKDGGYWMANWALNDAQFYLGRTCRENNVDFRLFHGRGGTVGRGGGQSNQAIVAMPALANNGRIRFTEQGEVISFRYSLPSITNRHLEQIVHAVAKVVMDQHSANDGYLNNKKEKELMVQIAEVSMQSYRKLIDNPAFWDWYSSITPVEQIGKLPIASRPVSRSSSGGMTFENLRAIPWVFAWTQVRYNVPGWFGIGEGIEAALKQDGANEILKRWYEEWTFFATILNNSQREMARTHLETSKLYNHESQEFHQAIEKQYALAEEVIKNITGQEHILDHNKVIKNSIFFRNPFTYPLNFIQSELLKRWKTAVSQEQKDTLTEILFLNINGIAAAMQSTG